MREIDLGGGPRVPVLGLGCMSMAGVYGTADRGEAIRTVHRALDLGVTMFDTADVYGPHTNEELLGEALAGPRRERAVVATKFGLRRGPGGRYTGVDGRPEYVRSACAESLRRLAVDHIDLYYLHRVDPAVPIEETVGAMAELTRAGKVRCEAWVTHMGRRTARTSGHVLDDDKVACECMSTLFIDR